MSIDTIERPMTLKEIKSSKKAIQKEARSSAKVIGGSTVVVSYGRDSTTGKFSSSKKQSSSIERFFKRNKLA